ncbi:glycine/betaine ABC transporter substrate-binding protein [Lactococcus lactis]|uniref:AbiI n=2 Tax=Lactococcus TaxID=1357 RepID=O33852_9LACT|nr:MULTISPECIES: hypothetical protein [Lactococcus]AAB66882.1 abiI [Lactococcus lactis subsp. lactis]MDN5611778.1 hypothetical protein [Staphylococcus equorum]MDN6423317.1 glycine/betaine ABC transporter substrate-binding protein [Tetragenococcus koreensis]KKW74457.1 abiI [Lactococcus cremoris]KKW74720.1 abiI [Lactococcus cremoris]
MINDDDNLYYTYLDECKKNFLTDSMKKEGFNSTYEEYSITSITFNREYYQTTFETAWAAFRNKYRMNGNKAMHFVDYKKLIDPGQRVPENEGYSQFIVNNLFSEEKLKSFFNELRDLLRDSEFFIVHTDYYWEKHHYLTKRNHFEKFQLSKKSRNVAPRLLNAVPYVAMRKHLDSLMLGMLKNKKDDVTLYLDEELPNKVYTKLRFDADGKQFDARTDLKKAYNHTITIGSDNVNQKTSSEILDEIRFIRKEEVGHNFTPSHCGLEIVDMLCSMIAGETRLKEYKKTGSIKANSQITSGDFINLKFPDGDIIEFESIIESKMRYHTINYLKY